MIKAMGRHRLKTNEKLEVKIVSIPEETYANQIVAFSSLKPFDFHFEEGYWGMDAIGSHQYWSSELPKCLRGDFKDRSDYFFVGEINNEIAGMMWYCAPKNTMDVATFGRVFTNPKYRGKGIAPKLMQIALATFREEHGLAMYLATGNPVAAKIYEKQGFQRGDNGIYRWVVSGNPERFDDEYYACREPLDFRPLTWADISRLEALFHSIALYAKKGIQWNVLYYPHGVTACRAYEGQFVPLMTAVDKKVMQCIVFYNNLNRVVGFAALTPLPSWTQSHVRVMDFAVHPNYLSKAGLITQEIIKIAVSSRIRRLYCYAAETDVPKRTLLDQAGFHVAGKFEKGLEITANQYTTLLIYEKEVPAI